MSGSAQTFADPRRAWQGALCHRVEFAARPRWELPRIAQPVGLREDDLQSLICHHPGPSELLPRRLQQLGLDPGFIRYARSATYRDLERVCAFCKTSWHCARDLANGEVEAGMYGYCPNAATIDALIVDR